MALMNLRMTILPVALALLSALAAHAASSDKATMELQRWLPICSEVLKAKQNPADETQESTDRPEGAESIAILKQLKRQGADLNAYYRLGTPLHHAACAGWRIEADWLLRNGADPFIGIEHDASMDALGIAVKTENWEVASMLLKHYQRMLKAPGISVQQQEQMYASVQKTTEQQNGGDSVRRFEKLLRDVGWKPSPQEWGKNFGRLLCSGQPKAALDVLKAKPWAQAIPREISDATWVCPIHSAEKIADNAWPKGMDMPTWRALDALLPHPVLLPLMPLLPGGREKEALQAAIASGLRAPWQNSAALYFQTVLSLQSLSAGATPALLRLVPEASLDTSPLGAAALLRAYAWPLSDLDWLLKHLSPSAIKTAQTSLYEWSDRASAEHWQRLTPHLLAPLPLPYGYPKSLPYALWPQWKALGAVPKEESWSNWLASVPLAELPKGLAAARAIKEVSPQTWPSDAQWAGLLLRAKPEELPDFVAYAKSQRPDLLARFMDWALAPLSYGPTPDAVALQIDRLPRYGRGIEGHWQRVRQLAASGFKSLHPRYLVHDVSEASAPVPTVEEAIRNGWIIAPPNAASRSAPVQWTPLQFACHKQVDDSLRRSLAQYQSGVNNHDHDAVWEYALPIQVNGLTDCQWLFVGGRFPGQYYWTEHDFFEGYSERRTNAADGNRRASFWNSAQKEWLDSGVVPDAGEFVLLQQVGQPAPWVAVSGRVDWGQLVNDVFQTRLQPDGTVVLEPLPQDHPARLRLIEQCGSDLMLDECQAVKDATQNGEQNNEHNNEQNGIAQFADTYWPQARQDFLAALMNNDRAALNRMREQGLFAHWLSAGLQALGEADALGLMEKRRRAAWILASSQPCANFDDATLASLVVWLPPEDWRPIVKVLRCYPRKALLDQVEEKKNLPLLTRLQNEMNRFVCPDE